MPKKAVTSHLGMKERLFRFKHFSVQHSRSAMKVGVDGVLVGAWADVSGASRILDAGCGCGLIALMCAQRNDNAEILAIDIDPEAADEANDNFNRSPWKDRLMAECFDIASLQTPALLVDLIVSNPPFFHSGVQYPDTPRELARHAAQFSPQWLATNAMRMLTPSGKLAMILPADQADDCIKRGEESSLALLRCCKVKGHPDAPVKRVLLEFSTLPYSTLRIEENTLILHDNGLPTEDYLNLCHHFYLKF